MPDDDSSTMDETCEEVQAFLDDCDCGSCNGPFEELLECAARQDGITCDFTVGGTSPDGESGGIPCHSGIYNVMTRLLIFVWWTAFVNW
mmetsp:Transcript_11506/g.22035  ORF Transcript_11506/g.22035 Transcript_11506/m.22035 type:complete len:89 (+) Transcript_11506:728-994(+)|eukprot:scaffold5588_cov180-Amphora_coffeaeformis.AAC.5